jgi:hypothetical protein
MKHTHNHTPYPQHELDERRNLKRIQHEQRFWNWGITLFLALGVAAVILLLASLVI